MARLFFYFELWLAVFLPGAILYTVLVYFTNLSVSFAALISAGLSIIVAVIVVAKVPSGQ